MNLFKPTSLALCVLSISTISFSQMKSDLGAQFEFGNEKAVLLEYRHPIANKWRINTKIGYMIDADTNPWGNGSIHSVDDSIITMRRSYSNKSGGDLRVSVSRDLRWPIFSVSTGILTGYRFSRLTSHSYQTVLSEDGQWYSYFGFWGNTDEAVLHTHSIVYGLTQGFHMNIPFGKRFVAFGSAIAAFNMRSVFRQDVIKDPLNEYPAQMNGGYSYVEMDMRFAIGLRYQFGKEKTFEKKTKE